MNYNTQFSVSVAEQLTQTEVAWIAEKLAQRAAYEDDTLEDAALNDYWLQLDGTAIVVEPESLLISSEDAGSPDATADFIQEFLAAHRPQAVVVLEWANTASRMAPGAFGGGVMVISATEIAVPPIQQWIIEAVARLEQNALAQRPWHVWPLHEAWERLMRYLPKLQQTRISNLLKRMGYLRPDYTLGQFALGLQGTQEETSLRYVRGMGDKSFALLQAALAAFIRDCEQQAPATKNA